MPGPKEKSAATKTACETYIDQNSEILSGFSITIAGDEKLTVARQGVQGALRLRTFFERDRPGGSGPRAPVAERAGVRDEWVEISLQAMNSGIVAAVATNTYDAAAVYAARAALRDAASTAQLP